MPPKPPFAPDYRAAQLAGREAASTLSTAAATRIAEDLRKWSGRLAADIASLGSGPTDALRRQAAEASRRIIAQSLAALEGRITSAVAGARSLAFDEVRDVWLSAQSRIAEAAGLTTGGAAPPWLADVGIVEGAAAGRVRGGALTMAAAYERLGGAARTWKTAIPAHIAAAGADLDAIVRTSLLEGTGPTDLARRLRPYVLGAEEFHVAFPNADERFKKLYDHRNLPPELRGAAKRLRYNATRIAYTETWNARAEAELESFAVDPAVGAVRWVTAPNRGQLRKPDICDAYASTNWYGLGPGVFPLDAVPLPPHPFCRCQRVPVLRDFSEWGKPKPSKIPRKKQVTDAEGLEWAGLPPRLQHTPTERKRVLDHLKAGFAPAKVTAEAAQTLRKLVAKGDAAALGLRQVAANLPGLFAAAKAAAVPIPPPKPMHEIVLAEKVGAQAGSNPGGLYRGSDGILRYVKFYADPAQGEGEALANAIYRKLGLGAPDAMTFAMPNGKTAFASTIIEGVGEKATVQALGLTAKRADAILDGVVADVFLANWDAVGLTLDNVVEVGGSIYRIDNGSAFLFRAQGGKKPANLLKQLSEWTGFAPGGVNPEYARVFKAAGVSSIDDLGPRAISQIRAIETLRESLGEAGWASLIDTVAPGMNEATRAAVVTMLDQRLALLTAKRATLEAAEAAAAEAAKLAAALDAKKVRLLAIRERLSPFISAPDEYLSEATLASQVLDIDSLDQYSAKVANALAALDADALDELAKVPVINALKFPGDSSIGIRGRMRVFARLTRQMKGNHPIASGVLNDLLDVGTKITGSVKQGTFWGGLDSVSNLVDRLVQKDTFGSLESIIESLTGALDEVETLGLAQAHAPAFHFLREMRGAIVRTRDALNDLTSIGLGDGLAATIENVSGGNLANIAIVPESLKFAAADVSMLVKDTVALLNGTGTPGMQTSLVPWMTKSEMQTIGAATQFIKASLSADVNPEKWAAFALDQPGIAMEFAMNLFKLKATPFETMSSAAFEAAMKFPGAPAQKLSDFLGAASNFKSGTSVMEILKNAAAAKKAASATPVAAPAPIPAPVAVPAPVKYPAQPADIVDAVEKALKGKKATGVYSVVKSVMKNPVSSGMGKPALATLSPDQLKKFKLAFVKFLKTGETQDLQALGMLQKAYPDLHTSYGWTGKKLASPSSPFPPPLASAAPPPAVKAAPSSAPKLAPTPSAPKPKPSAAFGTLDETGRDIVVVAPSPGVTTRAGSTLTPTGVNFDADVLRAKFTVAPPPGAPVPTTAQTAGQFKVVTGRTGAKTTEILAAKKGGVTLTPPVEAAISSASAVKDEFYLQLTAKTHDLVQQNGVNLSLQWSAGNIGLPLDATPTAAKFSSSVNKKVKLAASKVLKVRATNFGEDVAEFLKLTPDQYEALSAEALSKKLLAEGVEAVVIHDAKGTLSHALVIDPDILKVDVASSVPGAGGTSFSGKPSHPKATVKTPAYGGGSGSIYGRHKMESGTVIYGENGVATSAEAWNKGKNAPAGFIAAQDEAGKYLSSRMGGRLDYMLSQEKAAVVRYTGGSYREINNNLRRGGIPTPSDRAAAAGLWKKSLDTPVVLNRGVGASGAFSPTDTHPLAMVLNSEGVEGIQKRIGRVFTDRGFGSHTISEGTARAFSYDGVIMETYLPAGTPGAYLEIASQFGNEKEFLLPPGARYRILGVVTDTKSSSGAKVRIICELEGFDDF